MKPNVLLLSCFLFLASTAPLLARQSTIEAAIEDVASVDGIMAAVYESISGAAGEPRDWDRFRSLFHPAARLIAVGQNREGAIRVGAMTPDEYITNNGPFLEKNGFYEDEIFRTEELQFRHILHVFSTYASRRNADDPEPFMRGVNSFQLVHDGNRWWVMTILWNHETADAPIPPAFLPQAP